MDDFTSLLDKERAEIRARRKEMLSEKDPELKATEGGGGTSRQSD
jgi:hypothetical protein